MPNKFEFLSPDIVLREVDSSILPPVAPDNGALIIGQSTRGPAMKPIRVRNISDLDAVFGKPYGGNPNGDIYRNGNTANPTYGLYAARAWLASETSPVTFMRLAGEETSSGFTNAKAGWNLGGINAHNQDASLARLAYGLWMIPSHSAGTTVHTGSLAAIFYTNGAAMFLSGTIVGTSTATASAGTMIKSIGAGPIFKVQVFDGTNTENLKFTMSPTSNSGIRKVCNTDPQKLISNQKAENKNYFLGESFETEVADMLKTANSGSAAGDIFGILLPLAKENTPASSFIDHTRAFTAAKTGWFIANNPTPTIDAASFDPANMDKLFRFHSLIEGEQFQKEYCIRIVINSLGTTVDPFCNFTVEVFNMKDKVVVEPFNCNLNPNSEKYIAKVIGDKKATWSSDKQKFIESGEFPNNSDYIRVEMAGGNFRDDAIPFGFYGPSRPKPWKVAGNSTTSAIPTALIQGASATYVTKASSSYIVGGHTTVGWANYQLNATSAFNWPRLNLTEKGMTAGFKKGNFFGFRSQEAASNRTNVGEYNHRADFIDIIRALPDSQELDGTSDYTEISFVFSLDEIVQDSTNAANYYFEDGAGASSYTANSGTVALIETAEINKIVAPFMGGFDGVDITRVDPFSSDRVLGAGATALTNYAIAAVDKAIEYVGKKDLTDYDIIAMPGIKTSTLVDQLVSNVHERGDALAIVDVDDGSTDALEYKSPTAGSVSNVVTNTKNHEFDTSHAATYYPKVKVKALGNGASVTMPSSIAGIGAIASSEAVSGAPWFAPAGFNRGGIGRLGGQSGPVVTAAAESLTKAERDKLYLQNINPIASFPGVSAPVVFGQKTLQQTPSALDRINVRRLLIYLKKEIRVVAEDTLFDANVEATWNRFLAAARPILVDAQARFGIVDFKLVLDSTTTTPDLQDRNVLYAKIFIKPAYAIEFIAIDFEITRSGIEF